MRVVLSALGVVDQSREDDDSAFSTPPLSAGSIWRHRDIAELQRPRRQ